MVREAFQFTITLPADAEALPLFHELSRSMSRYLGLEEAEARQVGDMLDRLLAGRANGPEPTEPTERELRAPADRFHCDRRSDLVSRSSGPAARPPPMAHSRVRLSWRVRDDA